MMMLCIHIHTTTKATNKPLPAGHIILCLHIYSHTVENCAVIIDSLPDKHKS